ncbi:putative threonine protein [Hyaloraphidium curvatum]|nr:putative threonine protein [Hyaloraphidium curvatum]
MKPERPSLSRTAALRSDASPTLVTPRAGEVGTLPHSTSKLLRKSSVISKRLAQLSLNGTPSGAEPALSDGDSASSDTEDVPEVPAELDFPDPIIPHPGYLDERGPESKEPDYLQLILNAKVYDVAKETALHYAPRLSDKLGNRIYLKREDTQPVFSFKVRGAYNRMFHLSPAEKKRGVSCVSAGNHAQGVALAAKRLGVRASIFMPTTAPLIKVDNVRRVGGDCVEIIMIGSSFDECKRECLRVTKEKGLVFIPPFDDPYVVAGQGTIGLEILKQIDSERLDAVFVSVGGGGLIAGVAAFIKRVRPEVRVIGVNTVDSDAMLQGLRLGENIKLDKVGIFSDGTAVAQVGVETLRLAKKYVDDMVTCGTDEICSAIQFVFEDTRAVLEPSGGLAVAGMIKYLKANPQLKGGTFVAILCGANIPFDRLRFVTERARWGSGDEALIGCIIPERRGAVFAMLRLMKKSCHIVGITYRYSEYPESIARVFLGFQIRPDAGYPDGPTGVKDVLQKLQESDATVEVMDLTGDELAKTHVRHILGAPRSPSTERLFSFHFVEVPGAFFDFVAEIDRLEWNLSLVQYRASAGDLGYVLVGVILEDGETEAFEAFLEEVGQKYPWKEVTNWTVVEKFMR